MTPTRFISSRVVLSAVWIASAGLAINMALLATHGAAESPTPYVVVLKEISTGPKGIQPGSTQLFAVKANGSNMTSTDYFTTNRPASQRWIYLASGKRIETDELTGLKSTTYRQPAETLNQLRDPRSQCLGTLAGISLATKERLVGEEEMLGYSTYKISRGSSHIAWYARDLGCAMLRAVTTFSDGASELKAVSIHAGDPPESLFRADTLREVAPSVLYSLHGIEAVTVDSFYRAHQK